ncbi:MAG: hypothetical protein QNJ74_11230 [Trichodesmium sp. MO_231.B1]|nr:hypothetical protein [Trichodesmium sp. MO_231.B1]
MDSTIFVLEAPVIISDLTARELHCHILPNVEIIYGDSSTPDANFRVQAENPNESSNPPITPDKK